MALAASLAATVLSTPAVPAYAADSVDLSRPASLERGEEARVPHVKTSTRKHKDETIIDGDTRIRVQAKSIQLFGRSLDGYVYAKWGSGNRYTIMRVDAGGDPATVLLKGGPDVMSLVLSEGDGAQFTTTAYRRDRTIITVYDATDGSELSRGRIRGSATVLALGADRAVVGSWSPNKTFWWDPDTGDTELIVRKTGYEADIAADRVAWYTKDPYNGGCSVAARLGDPDEQLWRSCKQRIAGFSPDGAHAATIHILADGLGPNEVQLREVDGTVLQSYRASWFGQVMWEDTDTLILDANGKRKAAFVRCDGADCERASALRPAVP